MHQFPAPPSQREKTRRGAPHPTGFAMVSYTKNVQRGRRRSRPPGAPILQVVRSRAVQDRKIARNMPIVWINRIALPMRASRLVARLFERQPVPLNT
jgi:hypothetical protein